MVGVLTGGQAAPSQPAGAAAVKEAVAARARAGEPEYVVEEARDFQGQAFQKCMPVCRVLLQDPLCLVARPCAFDGVGPAACPAQGVAGNCWMHMRFPHFQGSAALQAQAPLVPPPPRMRRQVLKLVGVDNPQFTADDERWAAPIRCTHLSHVAIGANDVDAICRWAAAALAQCAPRVFLYVKVGWPAYSLDKHRCVCVCVWGGGGAAGAGPTTAW